MDNQVKKNNKGKLGKRILIVLSILIFIAGAIGFTINPGSRTGIILSGFIYLFLFQILWRFWLEERGVFKDTAFDPKRPENVASRKIFAYVLLAFMAVAILSMLYGVFVIGV